MPAILAKKLGMTQVFQDDGSVARVTVLEAGPCPVTAVRTVERDGYDAVQLAFGQTKEKHLSKPELGHLKKADAAPMRHLVEFRDEAADLQLGQSVTVDSFQVGGRVKIAGVSKGKGFQGTVKRHNFKRGPVSHGSHNVRAPGSIGASADPARVRPGIRGPGQMGNKRATQPGLEIVAVDATEEPSARARVGPRAARWRRGGAWRCLTRPCSARRLAQTHHRRQSSRTRLSALAFHGPLVHQSVRAEQAARRRGTAATKTRGMVSGGGAKPWRQKGTGRARAGSSRSPIWTGGGVVFGPQPRSYTFKVNRKEQRAALRSALSLHAQRGSLAVLDAAAFKAPKTSEAHDLLDDWNQPQPTLVVLGAEESAAALSFRNLARVAVLTPEDVGVADLLGAASLLVSEAALPLLTARVESAAKEKA